MKELKVKCFFGINRDNHSNESVFEINDDTTGKRIGRISFNPLQLTQLLGGMAYVEGIASFIDEKDYHKIGKTPISISKEYVLPKEFRYGGYEKFLKEEAKKFIESSEYDWEVRIGTSKNDTLYKEGEVIKKVYFKRYEK